MFSKITLPVSLQRFDAAAIAEKPLTVALVPVPVQLSSFTPPPYSSSEQLPPLSPLPLLEDKEHKVKRKDHPKCYFRTPNDEETDILQLHINIYIKK